MPKEFPKTPNRKKPFAHKALNAWLSLLLVSSVWLPGSALSARELENAEANSGTEESAPSYVRKEANYSTPEVKLVRQYGTKVSLPKELGDGRPVVLSFVYTSCTAICQMLTEVAR